MREVGGYEDTSCAHYNDRLPPVGHLKLRFSRGTSWEPPQNSRKSSGLGIILICPVIPISSDFPKKGCRKSMFFPRFVVHPVVAGSFSCWKDDGYTLVK